MFHEKSLTRPVGNSIHGIYDPFEVRWINRLGLGFSHLREHRFRHSFRDTVTSLWACTLETENTEHFFICCQHKLSAYKSLINEINSISNVINSLNSIDFIKIILHEYKNFDNVTNFTIIAATIKFVKSTKRFEKTLFETIDLLEIWNNVVGEYW